MGRIVELLGEIAAEAEEGEDGLILSPDAWERFRQDWNDEDIEDALSLVKDSLFQSDLIEAADSLNARLIEWLGGFGEATEFERAVTGEARLLPEVMGQLARRVDRLDEVLDVYREDPAPDRTGFDRLRRRLADQGLEHE